MVDLGKRIRIIRKQNKLTQSEFGKVLGFGLDNAKIRVSQYETGLRTPRKDIIEQIAKKFNVETTLLLSSHSDPLINIYIDLYWLLHEGYNVILVAKLMGYIEYVDNQRYQEFKHLLDKNKQP